MNVYEGIKKIAPFSAGVSPYEVTPLLGASADFIQHHTIEEGVERYRSVLSNDTDYGTAIKRKAKDRVTDDVLDLLSLDDTEKPTNDSMKSAFAAIDLMPLRVLEHVQVWPTDNCTIEFGVHVNNGNDFVLEASNRGISGVVTIDGDDHTIKCTDTMQETAALLESFSHRIAR